MLYVFGFERTGVAVGDLYFVDPDPPPGQEGAERGVRLEVRLLEHGPLPGSPYSGRPIFKLGCVPGSRALSGRWCEALR